ncbi:MAG: DUF998 domain-containing protein [Rubrivivax sp.]|nr:MAG: DUF998 domain-containing protein [Rubrivivax sp.]
MKLGRLAFALILLGEIVQWGGIVIGGAAYPGYDPLRQYISELGATGAVTGSTVSWWVFVPSGVFITAGCLIAAWMMRRSVPGVIGWLLLAWYGASLTGAGVYPCEFECARSEATFNALMHDLVGGTGYLAVPIGVWLVTAAAKMGRRFVAFGVVCGLLTLVGFGGVVADPEFGGLLQRVLEVAVTVFLLTSAWVLAKGRLLPATA